MADINQTSSSPTGFDSVEHPVLRSLVLQGRTPVLLLGAGASVTSGIPLAAEVTERIARWAWCEANGRSPHDQQVVRSDWWPWLASQAWFDKSRELSDLYPTAIEKLLGVKDRRKEFFETIMSRQTKVSRGYEALCRLLHDGWIDTVLTTNFDKCLEIAQSRLGRPHALSTIKTTSDIIRLNTAPSDPQLVYLHGSVEHYTDRNTAEEVTDLDRELIERITPILRDHPLVVIGYRGAEQSIMRKLFLDNVSKTNGFANGIYWCIRKGTTAAALPPMVLELAQAIRTNLQFVTIGGFDELLDDNLAKTLAAESARAPKRRQRQPLDGISFDMMPSSAGKGELDWRLAETRIRQYGAQLGISVPDPLPTNWLEEEAIRRNLLNDAATGQVPTFAGWLLFGPSPHTKVPGAWIDFEITGPAAWIRKVLGDDAVDASILNNEEATASRQIYGNLWAQLDRIQDLLSLINTGFRLKEEISRPVHAYAPLALKEIVVNALVHRNYECTAPVKMAVFPERIVVTNPGGLIDHVAAQTHGEPLERLVREGRRGIKGYRNPVISDLLYGGGQMDRKGSGLYSVVTQTRSNSGDVSFGPDASNTSFSVELFARPETVDEITNTASPIEVETVRFAANCLEVTGIPQDMWHAAVRYERISTARQAMEEGIIPPGYFSDGRVFSFYDLELWSDQNPQTIFPEDVEPFRLSELLEMPNGERALVQILNDALAIHLESIGMIVERDRSRAYFPKSDSGERQIHYQGRVRKAIRTVAKARMKRDKSEVIYWEHKAFSYQFVRFGTDWGLVINPGYAFTKDGLRRSLGRDRVNVLSTKRASRDYNQTVHQDLTFWAAILSNGADAPFKLNALALDGIPTPSFWLNPRPPTQSITSATIKFGATGADEDDLEMNKLQEELEELAGQEADDDTPDGGAV